MKLKILCSFHSKSQSGTKRLSSVVYAGFTQGKNEITNPAWGVSRPPTPKLIECLHDPANVQQTSSKRPALHLLEVCWTFAGSCKHPINDATAWSLAHAVAATKNLRNYHQSPLFLKLDKRLSTYTWQKRQLRPTWLHLALWTINE